MKYITVLMTCLLAIVSITSYAEHSEPYRIIIQAKDANQAIWKAKRLSGRPIAGISGSEIRKLKPIADGMFVYTVDKTKVNRLAIQQNKTPNQIIDEIANKLSDNPQISYATRDKKMKMVSYSHDDQWDAFAPPGGVAVDGPNGAWQITKGDPSIVVAVIDTGIAHHADLEKNVIPGYSFADHTPDNTDRGLDTSYHGTHVAGTIAANGNLLGMAPLVKIQPIKVLGDDGSGWSSDIIQGIYWAAGVPIHGYTLNPTPAKVLNLSLGGPGTCDMLFARALQRAEEKGATVIVAAGNEQNDARFSSPASCSQAITVAATNKEGSRSYYSNYGSAVDIAAPGGEQRWSQDGGILSTVKDDYAYYQGTSMAAPHVAGIAALMYSVNPDITPKEVKDIIKSSSTPFPSNSGMFACGGRYSCGKGIINAAEAVSRAASGKSKIGKESL